MAHKGLKKVLMTADAMGGVWTYTRALTTLLGERGIEVLVAVTGRAPTEALDACTVHAPLSLEWQDRAGDESCRATAAWLKHVAAGFQPDLIHLNGYIQAALAWNIPVVVAAHSCVYSWWRAVHGCCPPAAWQMYRERVSDGLKYADKVVAPSRAMLNSLQEEYGFPAERGQVIHNATALACPASRHEPLIVACGRSWDEAKNLSLLEALAPRLHWPLRIAGGDLTHAQTLELVARAEIFAHAAVYEPFGLGVLEAARSGCALVLSDIPSLRELWDGAAVFLNPRQPSDWLHALNSLIEDPARRRALALQACSRSRQYNTQAFEDAYLSLYRSAIKAHQEKFACA